MFRYSKMAENIPNSPIRNMMTRAAEMQDVISFAVGEPDFAPTDEIINAAKKALDAKDTKYAPGAGIAELRQVYGNYISKMTGISYTSSNIVVTAGGMASLFLSLQCLLDPGDEVLVSAPYFSNYNQMIRMCHGIPVPVDVFEEDDFVLTPKELQRNITPKTKVLILNSPCNPTGGVMSGDVLQKIGELAVSHDFFVISDEVYRHILFDQEKYESIAVQPNMKERTLIVDSCSKMFAMTGFRVGFGAGPEKLIQLMTKLTEGVYSCTPTVSQRAAIEAFRSGMEHCHYMVSEYERRRNYMYDKLNQIMGISCIKPKGAFYIFANISNTGMKAAEFCDKLLESEQVAVVPGNQFGSTIGDDYIRIAYATSMENIIEGCNRINRFCEQNLQKKRGC